MIHSVPLSEIRRQADLHLPAGERAAAYVREAAGLPGAWFPAVLFASNYCVHHEGRLVRGYSAKAMARLVREGRAVAIVQPERMDETIAEVSHA